MADALKYEYIAPSGEITRHIWTAVGDNGAVHIWAEPHSETFVKEWREHFFGGVEVHSPKPLYDSSKEADHHDCWLLKAPCWHDGSSLAFSEMIEPRIRHEPQPFENSTHDFMNRVLADWYAKYLNSSEAQ